MAVTNRKTAYPFAEVIEVTSQGTVAIDLWQIPKGTLIDKVLSVTKKALVGTVNSNLTVGDDDGSAGFLLAADATAAKNTVYGQTSAEQGTYIDVVSKGGKFYTSATKEVKFVLSTATLGTEGVYEILIKGSRQTL